MMGSNPRVSVIMAVYNGERYLREAVASVRNQTFEDWELVLIDDGSTDQTPAMCDALAVADRRIRVFHQKNSGLPAAGRNRAIREARGEFITFLDGDDLYHPDRIRRQIEILDACPEIGGVFHDFKWFADGTDPERGPTYLAKVDYVGMAKECLEPRVIGGATVWVGNDALIKFMSSETVGIHTSTITVRRPVIDGLTPPGFREELPHCEDIDMWLRIGRATRLAVEPVTLSYYRHNPSGWMATKDLRIRMGGSFTVKREMLEWLERTLSAEEWPRYRDKVAERWRGVAYPRLIAGFLPEARFAYWQSFRIGRSRRGKFLTIKGLLTSYLPRAILRTWWKQTGGGQLPSGPPPQP
jgi:glycosyltransferase involved in cell wall biosynthesis